MVSDMVKRLNPVYLQIFQGIYERYAIILVTFALDNNEYKSLFGIVLSSIII